MAQQPFSAEELSRLVAALCDGSIDQPSFARLEGLLEADPAARQWYLAYLDLHGELCWNHLADAARGLGASVPAELESVESPGARVQASEFGLRASGFGVRESKFPESRTPSPEPPIPEPELLIPPIIIDTSSTTHYPLFTIHSPLGGWLISYAAATVITGMMILGAWVYKVSHEYRPAASPSAAIAERQPDPKPADVGQISGMVDCRWTDPDAAPSSPSAAVPLGQKYELDSGLVEISYTSGAKVILQGPCSYQVDSAAGGFLSLGKLTAMVERSEVRGQESEIRNQKSEISNPESPIPNPLFVVKTPTATVTDLGTEFGVEVDRSGGSQTRVFRGRVEVRPIRGLGASAPGAAGAVLLGENDSVRVEAGREAAPAVVRHNPPDAAQETFVRELPRWTRLKMKLFNTGLELKEGDADPHWQIVAASNGPKFKPQAAIVTVVNVPPHAPQWEPNEPRRSQWVSTAGDLPDLPFGVTYTFRTTFELPGLLPGSAVLRGRYMVDDYVKAIRLNGHSVPFPDEHNLLLVDYQVFTADKGFVDGTNILEIDVLNGQEGGDVTAVNPMLLRMELDGTFTGRDSRAPQGGGKEVEK